MTNDLEKPLKPKLNEIASAKRDVDIFYGWLGFRDNPDKLLRAEGRGRGVRVYEELERDDQVFANLQARRLAVVGCEWEVIPKTDEPQDARIADFVRSVLEETNFDQGCFEMLQGLLTGYKVTEIMWRTDGGAVRIEEFREPRAASFHIRLGRQSAAVDQGKPDGRGGPSGPQVHGVPLRRVIAQPVRTGVGLSPLLAGLV